jgi:hypothetical protein
MTAISYLQQRLRLARRQKQHRLAQGRLTSAEAAGRLSVEGHIPLAAVPGLTSNPFVAIPADEPGHLLLVAPPDSGWREHLAVTLAQWPARQAVVTFFVVEQVLSGIVSLLAVLGGVLPSPAGWMSVAFNLVFALAFGYFRFVRPEGYAAPELQS